MQEPDSVFPLKAMTQCSLVSVLRDFTEHNTTENENQLYVFIEEAIYIAAIESKYIERVKKLNKTQKGCGNRSSIYMNI